MSEPRTPLRDIRESRRIGLRTMADTVGIAASTLSRIETGKRRASPDVARKIAQHYGVTLEQVLYPE